MTQFNLEKLNRPASAKEALEERILPCVGHEVINEQLDRLEHLKVGLNKIREFESGAKRDDNSKKPYVHSIKGYTRLRFGFHMTSGALKYGDKNWEKGIPTDVYLESIDRHLAKYRYNIENNLPQEEDHLSAIFFGIQGCMINEEKDGIKIDHFFKLNND